MRPSRPTISDGIANLPRRLVLIAAAAASLPAMAAAAEPTTRRTDFLPYGTESFHIPPAIERIDVPPRAIELLTSAIRTQTGPDRSLYVTSLGACGPAGLPPLRPLLHDVDPTIRADAVRAIGAIGSTDAAADVRPLLGDPDADVRREAALALPKLGDAAALTPALTEGEPAVRIAAYAGATTREQVEIILNHLSSLDPAERPLAIEAIGRAGTADDVSQLFALATAAEPAERMAVIRAISRARPAGGEAVLSVSLHDGLGVIRREALKGVCGWFDTADQQSAAFAALNDSDPTVRQAAADLFAATPTSKAIDPLRRQLDDRYEPAHLAARSALIAVGPSAYPAAEQLLDDDTSGRRIDGLRILGETAEPLRVDRRIALLKDLDYRVVAAAAKSLVRALPIRESVEQPLLDVVRRVQSAESPTDVMCDAEAAAIRLAGYCGCKNMVPEAIALIPLAMGRVNAPADVRDSSMWAVGLLANFDSEAGTQLRDMLDNMLASGSDIFCADEALVNMRDPNTLAGLKNWRTDRVINSSEALRFVAHLVDDRDSHRSSPYLATMRNITPFLPVADNGSN